MPGTQGASSPHPAPASLPSSPLRLPAPWAHWLGCAHWSANRAVPPPCVSGPPTQQRGLEDSFQWIQPLGESAEAWKHGKAPSPTVFLLERTPRAEARPLSCW